MKFLLLFLAAATVVTSSVINRRNVKLMDDSTIIMDQNKFYGDILPFNDATLLKTMVHKSDLDRNLVGDVGLNTWMDRFGMDTTVRKMYEVNPMMLNTMTNDMEVMNWPNMFTTMDKQTTNVMIKILMRMFDQKVMMHMLDLYGIDQTRNEMILDRMLTTQGIFDKRMLMEVIKDSYLRNMMIKERIFDETVMDVVMNRQLTIIELENLINRQVLKNWMITFGCCNKDIFRRMVHETIIENMMTNEQMDRLWLLNVIQDSMMTRFLVQKGIFYEHILEKCLLDMRTHMMTRDDLLKQLINRRMLRIHLMQRGFIDTTMLNRMMTNEILGLKVLLNILTLDQTPNMTYKEMMGMVFNKPEWMLGQMGTLPVGDNVFGVTMGKRTMFPFMTMTDDVFTNRDRTFMRYNLWNIIPRIRGTFDNQMMQGYGNNFDRRHRFSYDMPIVQLMN